jgi:hypothetical protein
MHIYQQDSSNDWQLIRRIEFMDASDKTLNARRAAKIIKQHFPDVSCSVMSRREDGWYTSHTFKPKRGCFYHYEWRHIVVSEAK